MLTAYEQGSTVVIVPLEARARPTAVATAPWRSPSEDVAWAGDELPGGLA